MLKGADVVVTRHTASLRTLRAAGRIGVFSVLDYSIVHHRSLAAAQGLANRRFPELASSFQETPDSPRPLKRLDEELGLAERILTFSPGHAQSMVDAGIPPAKLLICPLGVDATIFPYRPPRKRQSDEPFNVLFVGQITQRKGVGDLAKAFSMLPPDRFTLTLVGPISGQIDEWLTRHNAKLLPPVPRAALARVHATADAFVFLSTAEGFPQTPLEAMASGLPVIVSPQAYGEGGPITHGIDGLVVDPQDHAKVAELLRSLADDPAWAADLGRAAAKRARDFTWERFCEGVYQEVSALIRADDDSP
jgi:glycosyltransferase involved in cell wall biosynthesis